MLARPDEHPRVPRSQCSTHLLSSGLLVLSRSHRRHKAKKTAHKVAHTVKKAAHAVSHAARTAYHATVKAAKSTATFVKHHAAAITSFVVSTAVFAGCEAVTGGVGSIGCAAVAGAAGSLVTQGFACAQSGGDECSVGAFAGSAAEGALAGAAGGLLGKAGGALLAKAAPKAKKVVGGLFGRGATDAGESAAADATDQAALAQETRGAVSESGSRPGCTDPHRVLPADGTTKPIDQVKVGDTIANAVPGLTAMEAHEVTAVIVTQPRTSLSEKARAKARRAAVALTALGALAGAAGPAAASGPASASAPVSVPAPTYAPAALHTTFHHPSLLRRHPLRLRRGEGPPQGRPPPNPHGHGGDHGTPPLPRAQHDLRPDGRGTAHVLRRGWDYPGPRSQLRGRPVRSGFQRGCE
ncbi:hypothetical protein [Streptomyces sp. SID11385]|uniref:hypothetical protein n=1 Tax=Streptomyces sp. SID11385 TaxID=2706031 RepID=UPI0023B2513E|nr:hypothetical protein [Streptomyces sp. SID11385]